HALPTSVPPAAVAPNRQLHFLREIRQVLLDLRDGDPQVAEDAFVKVAAGGHAVALAEHGLDDGRSEERILPRGFLCRLGHGSGAELGTVGGAAATARPVVFLLADLHRLRARLRRMELAAEVHLLPDGED